MKNEIEQTNTHVASGREATTAASEKTATTTFFPEAFKQDPEAGPAGPSDAQAGADIDPRTIKVVLASASPRRKELLEQAEVSFKVQTADIDEFLDADLMAQPAEAAKKLAEKKAGAVVQQMLAEEYVGCACVIGADTMVVLGSEVFGKPRNLSDAKGMLRKLSGRTHQVITAVSLWMLNAPEADKVSLGFRTFAESSLVAFKTMTDDEIVAYLRSGESFDKAGAYAAQGEGAKLIENIEGELDTVIGLPVKRLIEEFPELLLAGKAN